MTVSTQSTLIAYLGDDVAVSFPFTFPVYDENHIQVYKQDVITKVLTLVATSAYSVTGVGDENGGTVTLTVPPTSDTRVIISRRLPYTQDLDINNQGGYYPQNVELELDLLAMQIQQLGELSNRAVVAQLGESLPTLPTAPERAGKLLGFTDDPNAYPTTDTDTLLFNLLVSLLDAGPGIDIIIGDGSITIKNTLFDQEPWLLEESVGGTGGSGGTTDPEVIRDVIGAALRGTGCTITVNDPGDTITIDLSGSATAEIIRDTIGATLVAGSGVTIAVNDAANTITISSSIGGGGDDDEAVRDVIGAALVGGVGITIAPDDPGNTISITAKPDILAVGSAATVTPTFSINQVNITAQAVNLTLANPTGTAIDGHGILIRVKDNGTARAITYGTKYRVFNDVLPTTTTAGKVLYIGIIYNLAADKWDVVGIRKEA